MNKSDYFKEELELIHNLRFKDFLLTAIEDIPEYFFRVPASSTGKFHPQYALGEGGLVRHTKAAVKIAQDLFRLEEYKFQADEQELIICALILHDSRKAGYDFVAKDTITDENASKTLPLHPKYAALAILKNKNNCEKLTKEELRFLITGITSHMGQWNTNKEGQIILPKPNTRQRKFIHLCDYLASRKAIEVNFNCER